jgi:hypothetical protein
METGLTVGGTNHTRKKSEEEILEERILTVML